MQFGLEQQFRFVSDDLGFRRWPNPLLHSWYPLLCIIMLCQVTLESLSSPSFWKWGIPVFHCSFFQVLPWLFPILWHALMCPPGQSPTCVPLSLRMAAGAFSNNHGDEQLGKSSLRVCIRPVHLEPGLTVPGEHREDEDVWPWAGAKSPDRLWQQGHWSGITLRMSFGIGTVFEWNSKDPTIYQLHFGHALKNTGTTRQPWKNAHLSMCCEGIMCPKHSKTTGPHPEH